MAAAAGEMVELVHYTPRRIVALTNRPSNLQKMITSRTGKPSGFWYSYRGEWKTELHRGIYADSVFEYIIRVPAYSFTEDIFSGSPTSILRLTADNIVGFVQKYHNDTFLEIEGKDSIYFWSDFWNSVKVEWGGIEFLESLRTGPMKIPIHHGLFGDIHIDISKMIETLDIFPSGVLFKPADFLKGANFTPKEHNIETFFKNVGPSVRTHKAIAKKSSSPSRAKTAKARSPRKTTAKATKAKSPPRSTGGSGAALAASLLKKR